MLAFEMRTPIAVTETAEVTTGWERGGNGVRTTRSAAGGRASITFGYYRRPPARTRTWDVARRPDLKADAWQPGAGRRGARLALCSPLLDPSRPYVSRMLPQVSSMSPMLAHVGPMLALCWPNLALSCPYVGPILPLCWPYGGLCWCYVGLS